MMRNGIVAILALMAAISCFAADVTWTGTAGDGLWETPENWSTGALPGESDRVKINTTCSIQLGADRTVGSVVFGDNVTTADNGNLAGEDWTLTVTTGSISGGKSAVIACKVSLPGDGTLICKGNYGNKLVMSNDVTCVGTLLAGGGQNNNLHFLGSKVTTPLLRTGVSGLVLSSALDIDQIDFFTGWADGDKNRSKVYFRNPNLSDKLVLHSVTNSAAVSFQNFDDPYGDVRFYVPCIKLDHGLLNVRCEHYAAGTNIVTIGEVQHKPGAIFTADTGGQQMTINGAKINSSTIVYGENAGIKVIGAENNEAGIWQPWALNNYQYLKVNDAGCLVTCDVKKDYTLIADGGAGCSPTVKYCSNLTTLDLTQNTELYSLYNYAGTDSTMNLGNYDLRFAGGALLYNGNGTNLITSTGGRLVFASEDVIFTANGANFLRVSAPLAWDGTEYDATHRPSLIVERTSGKSVIFDGDDQIGVYNQLFSETGKTTQYVELGGSSDREFKGEIGGVFNLYKTGTGKLTFSGPNVRRGGGLNVYAGQVRLNHNQAPKITLATGDSTYCVLNGGISWNSGFTVTNDAVMCGFGTITFGVGSGQLTPSGYIGGGAPGQTGTLTVDGDFSAVDGQGFYVNIDETTNSVVAIKGSKRKFTLPAEGSKLRIRVAWTGGENVNVRNRTFKFFDWGKPLNVSPQTSNKDYADSISFEIVNDSPKKLDVSQATAAIDVNNWCINLTGIREVGGMAIRIR